MTGLENEACKALDVDAKQGRLEQIFHRISALNENVRYLGSKAHDKANDILDVEPSEQLPEKPTETVEPVLSDIQNIERALSDADRNFNYLRSQVARFYEL